MARAKTNKRWTPEDVEILRECWPKMHEQDVLNRLGGNRTVISVRYKAQRLGLRKGPERWAHRGMIGKIEEMQIKLTEAEQINRVLREHIKRLDIQIKALSLRASLEITR